MRRETADRARDRWRLVEELRIAGRTSRGRHNRRSGSSGKAKHVIRFASLTFNPDEPKTRPLPGTNRVLWTSGGERDPMAALAAERQEEGFAEATRNG